MWKDLELPLRFRLFLWVKRKTFLDWTYNKHTLWSLKQISAFCIKNRHYESRRGKGNFQTTWKFSEVVFLDISSCYNTYLLMVEWKEGRSHEAIQRVSASIELCCDWLRAVIHGIGIWREEEFRSDMRSEICIQIQKLSMKCIDVYWCMEKNRSLIYICKFVSIQNVGGFVFSHDDYLGLWGYKYKKKRARYRRLHVKTMSMSIEIRITRRVKRWPIRVIKIHSFKPLF